MGGAKVIKWPLENIDLAQDYDLQDLIFKGRYRAVLRVGNRARDYALKCVARSKSNLEFSLKVLAFLDQRQFTNFPHLIPARNGEYFINLNKDNYFLMEWINGRESNFLDRGDLEICATTLGKLHKLTKDFAPGNMGRVNNWSDRLEKLRSMELGRNHHFITEYLPKVIESGEKALYLLGDHEVLTSAFQPSVVCHHDLTHRNFLIAPNGVGYLIDFDYAVADVPARDLSQFLTKVLKRHRWDLHLAHLLLTAYSKENPLTKGDLGLFLAFLHFPRTFRELASYFSVAENDPVLLEKLKKKVERHLSIQPFLNRFRVSIGF